MFFFAEWHKKRKKNKLRHQYKDDSPTRGLSPVSCIDGLPTVRGKNTNCQKSSVRGKLMSAQRGIFARPSQRRNDISAVHGNVTPRLRDGLPVGANFLRPFLCSAPPQALNPTAWKSSEKGGGHDIRPFGHGTQNHSLGGDGPGQREKFWPVAVGGKKLLLL